MILPVPRGHSSCTGFDTNRSTSMSPEAAQATTVLPDLIVVSPKGTKSAASSSCPVSSPNSRSAASRSSSADSTRPFGMLHAPSCLFLQNGPPGWASKTCRLPSTSRYRSTPALTGFDAWGIAGFYDRRGPVVTVARSRYERPPTGCELFGSLEGDRVPPGSARTVDCETLGSENSNRLQPPRYE